MYQKIQPRENNYSTTLIQPKLEIGKEDDKHEKEADQVAEKVMKMREDEPQIQKMRMDSPGLQKMRSDEDDTIKMRQDSPVSVQKQSQGAESGMYASQDVEQGINSSKGSGAALSPDVQQEMGSKMNADFSDVKVHTGQNAVQMNKEISAKAFTHGSDIYFNSGQYNPSSNQGKQLLAHELTHTMQQGGASSLGIQKKEIPFAEATSNGDKRTLYINGAAKFKKIKQLLTSVDVTMEGEPVLSNIQKKTPPKGSLTEFYVGTSSTTSATKPTVTALLDAIVPVKGEVYVTTDEFITKLQTLLDAFRKEQPNSFSNLQVLGVMNQKGLVVNDDSSCIETMNKCIENVVGSSTLKKSDMGTTSQDTIKILEEKGLAGASKIVSVVYTGTDRFQITGDNVKAVTKFSTKTFADTLTELVMNKEDGYYIHPCALLNGYHSLIIIVKKEKGTYRFLWKDQHDTKEFTATALNDEFYGYVAGRYSWVIRHKYAEEFGGEVPAKYSEIRDEERTKDIEKQQKANILLDLKTTIISPLSPTK